MTLAVNQLIGFGAVGQAASAPVATKTYRGSQVDTVDRTTYNAFSTVTVSATDTYIVVGVIFLASTTRALSSVSITGNVSGARSVLGSVTGNSTAAARMVRATLASDTSVTISFTLNGAGTCGAIAVWSGAGADTSVPSILDDNTHSYLIADDVPDGGVAFGLSVNSNTSSPTVSVSGTGWSKEEDLTLEGGIKGTVVSASGPVTDSLSVSYSSNTNPGNLRLNIYSAV